MLFNNKKSNRKLIKLLIEKNNNEIYYRKVDKNNYILYANLNLDDINFPEEMSYKIRLYTSTEDELDSLQLEIYNEENKKFGVLNCKMTHKMENERKKTRKKLKEAEKQQEEEKKQKQQELTKKQQELANKYNEYDKKRFEDYKRYMIKTGANEELFDLPVIKEIIENIIKNGDPRLKMEGHSPIYYMDANEDGTFNICGRTNGPNVNVVYKMEYSNDENKDHYITMTKYSKITKKQYMMDFDNVNFPDPEKSLNETIFYIDKDGNIIDNKINNEIDVDYDTSLFSDLKEKGKLTKFI